MGEAWGFTLLTAVLAWLLAFLASPDERRECFWIVIFTSFLCWAYSAPPLWTKRRGFLANLTIAIPRGVLLKVAGWSTVKTIVGLEPWFIGSVFGLFLLGAASTKDFADIEGDRAGGCTTLPILYGVKAAAWIIAPFFVLPFFLIPFGVWRGILTGNPTLLLALAALLIVYSSRYPHKNVITISIIGRNQQEVTHVKRNPNSGSQVQAARPINYTERCELR